MIEVGRAILSIDLLDKHFVCDLEKCKGICCVEGDSGAPLTQKETKILDKIYPTVKTYMTLEGIKAIEEQGCYITDFDGDLVTPLIDNMECAYVIRENGVAGCAIEKAYHNKKVKWRKPLSCHLYPIRIQEYENLDAVNYDKQDICNAACKLGDKLKVPVYKFLKEPLIRKYGKKWYEELEMAVNLINPSNEE